MIKGRTVEPPLVELDWVRPDQPCASIHYCAAVEKLIFAKAFSATVAPALHHVAAAPRGSDALRVVPRTAPPNIPDILRSLHFVSYKEDKSQPIAMVLM